MKIRLTSDISGSRNGTPWPARGSVVDLPDDEGARMCRNGMAKPVDGSTDDVETATVDDSEQRGLTTASAASLVPNQQDASGNLVPVEDPAAAPKSTPAKTPAKKAAPKPAAEK